MVVLAREAVLVDVDEVVVLLDVLLAGCACLDLWASALTVLYFLHCPIVCPLYPQKSQTGLLVLVASAVGCGV